MVEAVPDPEIRVDRLALGPESDRLPFARTHLVPPMVLEGYRAWSAPYFERMARRSSGTSPVRLSWTALSLSAAAGVLAALARFTTPMVFLGVAVLIFAGGVFDVLDGEVARRTGRAGPKGDLLDHVLDRYADLFVLIGIAVSGYAYPPLALLALVSLLMTSYMGTQAQAVGLGRDLPGPARPGRPPRVAFVRHLPDRRPRPPVALGAGHPVRPALGLRGEVHRARCGHGLVRHRRSVDGVPAGAFVVPLPASPPFVGSVASDRLAHSTFLR